MDQVIAVLFKRLGSKNERISLEAAKAIMDKLLPNAKVDELGSKHAPISVFISNQGFIPPNPDIDATSTGSFKRLTPLQSPGVAPQGKKDDHSHK
jgi:hypothetical protein